MKQISIIIAVYNREKYLRECLDSVFAQKFKDFEVILVNDGSTDNSEMIIEEYKKKYQDKVIYLKKENGGVSSARNLALDHAKSKYVTFLDSDDYVSDDYLSVLFEAAEKYQSEMVVSGQFKVNEEGGIIDRILYFPDSNGNSLTRRLNISGKLYLRDFIEKQAIRFPIGKTYEDNTFNIVAYFLAKNLRFLEYAGYYQVVHEGSITSKKIAYESLPMEAIENAIKQVESNPALLKDRALFEFTVMSFFTYFIFVRNKKKEYLDTNNRTSDMEDVLKVCDEFARMIRENFKHYASNEYCRLFRKSDLVLKQKLGAKVFGILVATNMLKTFVKLYYRL